MTMMNKNNINKNSILNNPILWYFIVRIIFEFIFNSQFYADLIKMNGSGLLFSLPAFVLIFIKTYLLVKSIEWIFSLVMKNKNQKSI